MKSLFFLLTLSSITFGHAQIANPNDTLLVNVRNKIALINYTSCVTKPFLKFNRNRIIIKAWDKNSNSKLKKKLKITKSGVVIEKFKYLGKNNRLRGVLVNDKIINCAWYIKKSKSEEIVAKYLNGEYLFYYLKF
jgi:hypothetical protein